MRRAMDLCREGAKPLLEPMRTQLTDAYVSSGLNVLTHQSPHEENTTSYNFNDTFVSEEIWILGNIFTA